MTKRNETPQENKKTGEKEMTEARQTTKTSLNDLKTEVPAQEKSPNEAIGSLRLFSPLIARLYTYTEYGIDQEPEEMSGLERSDYKDKILQALQKDILNNREKEKGLAAYLEDEKLKQKIISMKPTVEIWQKELWGVLEIKSHGELTQAEMNDVREYWQAQQSDGWGESFEQTTIEIELGEMNVCFYHNSPYFFITPEQELKSGQIPSQNNFTLKQW